MVKLGRIAWLVADKVAMDIMTAEGNNYPVTREFIWKQMNYYSETLPAFGAEKLTVSEKEHMEGVLLDAMENGWWEI